VQIGVFFRSNAFVYLCRKRVDIEFKGPERRMKINADGVEPKMVVRKNLAVTPLDRLPAGGHGDVSLPYIRKADKGVLDPRVAVGVRITGRQRRCGAFLAPGRDGLNADGGFHVLAQIGGQIGFKALIIVARAIDAGIALLDGNAAQKVISAQGKACGACRSGGKKKDRGQKEFGFHV
jgi:hypothetical protein